MSILTNPRNIYSDEKLNNLPIIIHNNIELRVLTITWKYKSPGCQCYKHCDCPKKGEIKETMTINKYRVKEFDGTDKAFYPTIKGAIIRLLPRYYLNTIY